MIFNNMKFANGVVKKSWKCELARCRRISCGLLDNIKKTTVYNSVWKQRDRKEDFTGRIFDFKMLKGS